MLEQRCAESDVCKVRVWLSSKLSSRVVNSVKVYVWMKGKKGKEKVSKKVRF